MSDRILLKEAIINFSRFRYFCRGKSDQRKTILPSSVTWEKSNLFSSRFFTLSEVGEDTQNVERIPLIPYHLATLVERLVAANEHYVDDTLATENCNCQYDEKLAMWLVCFNIYASEKLRRFFALRFQFSW